jgi:hypothetical protein
MPSIDATCNKINFPANRTSGLWRIPVAIFRQNPLGRARIYLPDIQIDRLVPFSPVEGFGLIFKTRAPFVPSACKIVD